VTPLDERWAKALRAKGIGVGAGRAKAADGQSDPPRHAERQQFANAIGGTAGARNGAAARSMPFKATGHKGGISRQHG